MNMYDKNCKNVNHDNALLVSPKLELNLLRTTKPSVNEIKFDPSLKNLNIY